MLLIGQPKSATTSFMWSLAEVLKIAHKNGHNKCKGDVVCAGFEEIQKYHGTTVKRNFNYLNGYINNRTVIYKEHILPTKEHISIINKINKNVVVLLRGSKNTVKSYQRVFSVLPEVEKRIDYESLENDLIMFQDIYINEAKANKIYKIIWFEDLIKDFTKTIKGAIIHYGFNIPKDINKYILQKRNYTYR